MNVVLVMHQFEASAHLDEDQPDSSLEKGRSDGACTVTATVTDGFQMAEERAPLTQLDDLNQFFLLKVIIFLLCLYKMRVCKHFEDD